MVTMTEVAARAGVSQATVSFVLGGGSEKLRISSKTRQRVLSAAQELGYQRNQLARAMITGKSRILGVLTSPESGENIIRALTGAVEAASSNDYFIKVIHLSHGGIDDATITRCLEWRLAGAIVVGLSEESCVRLNQEFRAKGVPLTMIDNSPISDWGRRIRSNDEQGIRQIVSHLISLGHSKIAFLGGRPSYLSNLREATFRAAMAEAGLSAPEHWIKQASWGDQGMMEEMIQALFQESGDQFPTAIACSSDSIAMVVQRIARSLRLKLPEDLSITGYSNANLSPFADPSLTTVDQAFYDMGHAAAMHLIERAENRNPEKSMEVYPDFLVPTKLLVRKSTTTAPKG